MPIDWASYSVRPVSGGRVRCEVGWSLDANWNRRLRDFDVWFVWAGTGTMLLRDREVALRPGVCLWMRPGGFYRATQNPDDRLGVTFVHFDLVKAGKVDRRPDHLPPEVQLFADVHYADAVLRRISEVLPPTPRVESPESSSDAAHRHGTAASLLRGVLMDYDALAARATPEPDTATDRRHREVVLAIASRIHEQPADAPSIDDLARGAGYSRDHFSRVFKQVLGQTPRDYVISARVNRAAQLLTESSLPIGQVAYASGYDDVYYFSRQFRQKMGQSPTAYRRSR